MAPPSLKSPLAAFHHLSRQLLTGVLKALPTPTSGLQPEDDNDRRILELAAETDGRTLRPIVL
jgi:hypothetical protein